jgi:hypothetical protein
MALPHSAHRSTPPASSHTLSPALEVHTLSFIASLEPLPKRLHPLRTEASGYRFQVHGATRRIEVRPVYSSEAHPFRETLLPQEPIPWVCQHPERGRRPCLPWLRAGSSWPSCSSAYRPGQYRGVECIYGVPCRTTTRRGAANNRVWTLPRARLGCAPPRICARGRHRR